MPKVKTKNGRRFVKELGGAVKRSQISKTAQFLSGLTKGRVLDYGCGFGTDADFFHWEAYDPYYRQVIPKGLFDSIVCIHVANVLTRQSRLQLYSKIQSLLNDDGVAFIAVARNIPERGKEGIRKRIQNYVVLSLPSVFKDKYTEIYRLTKADSFEDRTKDFI